LQAARIGDLLASIIIMLRSVTLVSVAALSCLGIAGCSSDEGDAATANARAGDIRTNETWTNGLELTGTVSIIGAVVEIAPGATIKCTKGVRIQIAGTLKKAPGARSKIACSDWDGILVAQGGKVELEDFEMENATTGIETTDGAADSFVKKSTITNSLHPFEVRKNSKLTVEDVKATTPKQVADNQRSITEVFGTFIAKKLDYDAGPSEGIQLLQGGVAEIEDSFVHGTGGQDMVSAYDAKSLKLSYSKVTGAHCGPHIQGIDTFTIDHLLSENNTYGITIYKAAGAGPFVVKDSNLSGGAAWLDLQGTEAAITFDNVYVSGSEVIKDTTPPNVTKASGPVPGVGPR
jgi:hypothetical protein